MIIGIDIDQTLSRGLTHNTLQESIAYCTRVGIVVPTTISRYADLFQMPEVLPLHETMPGAVEGVNTLAEIGEVWYYTVRKDEDAQVERAMHDATREWLRAKNFPRPTQVVFCQSVLAKLVKFYEQQKANNERLLLIDDRWQQALEDFAFLDEHSDETAEIARVLRRRLTLVAFGASDVPESESESVHMVALPSWSNLSSRIVELIGKP